MPDHVWGIGGGAEMMIRDHGMHNGHIEFWFRAGPYTWNNQQDWGYDAGWGYIGRVFRLNSGGGWHHLETVHIPTRRNVMMRMVGEGLGWGTSDRTAFIERARRPDPPHPPHIGFVNHESIRAWLNYGWDGGMGIDNAEIWWSDDPHNAKWLVGNTRDHQWHGLAQGRTYYFWGKTHNPMGWSDLSGRSQATTHRVPDPPSPVWFENVTQTSVRFRFNGGWDGGTPIREWQLTFGRNPTTGEVYRGSNGTNDEYNLVPAATYYAWARGRNDVGWGPWSSVRSQTLRAGAMVKHAGVWRRALPYVKVNGVWRLARPRVKHAGVWKETS